MDGYGVWGSNQDSSKFQDLKPMGANPTGDTLFDASQYEFFGGDAVKEVELGGLEDEEDDVAPVGFEDKFQLDKEEGDLVGGLSEIDDLSSTFSKLNKVASGPTSAGITRDWGSRESSSASGLAQDADFSNWYDQPAFDAETAQENKKWSSHPYSSPARFIEPNPLHRTSSYPEQRQQQYPQQQILRHQHSSEPILIPNSPFTSYPPNQSSPNGRSTNIPYHPHIAGPNSQIQPNAFPHGLPWNCPINNCQLQNNLPNQSNFPNNFSSRQYVFPQMMPPQQTRMPHPFQMLNPRLSRSPPKFDLLGLPDLRDQRAVSLLRNRQPIPCHPHQVPNHQSRFRSKYMSPSELENIHRMQLAATHSNDPYVEDYYHQAILARKSAGAKLRHQFFPSNLRDSSSKSHSNTNEPHPFLQVDALGRVSFSSIRRPRPLLEVNTTNSSNNAESKFAEKPLEQEPLLAARVAIEDGIYLLLDVDDIDRFLQFNQLPDGGAHLRQRRQVLLEGLASSLQLVDPLGKNGGTVNLAPEDDFVFLRLVSLPKGKKLLLRYLEVLSPGELARVVCMAICRNLRFLFVNESSTVISKLAETVSACIRCMDLKSLSSCFASVVCSSEHPPLRPIGHASGDGASVILKSVLERATELLTDPSAAVSCSVHQRAFWQASFDAFFGLLTKYCFNKYDSVVQSFNSQGSSDTVSSDVAKAISREMPVELLRASLPHTSEQQRKLLLEFAQRSMPVTGISGSS
ncbi:hypothetical protein CASFOL_040529 [Castilleja foliolosa]|uniref:Uncharacterized protein n=1 Tax=Castilleja foliolosa TaxID=1961234 RepID=A0ABD3BCD8_9LAMI